MTWPLPPVRPGHRADDALVARREAMESVVVAMPAGAPVDVVTSPLGGVMCVSVIPRGGDRGVMLYLHGGGFRVGSAAGWTGFAARLAIAAGIRVVLVDYRLAPEHPFPAAIHDAVAVYDELRRHYEPVFVGGDSAGGGLALSLSLACRGRGGVMPDALILLSPWVDLTASAGTYVSNAACDTLFSFASASEAAALYMQGHDVRDPLASGLFADHRGMAPTLVLAGGAEVLLDDALGLAAALSRADVPVQLRVDAGMQHVYPLLFAELAQSVAALETIRVFVAERLSAERR